MKHAETVTFGGSGLDRAAYGRPNAADILTQQGSRVIVFWRGKALVNQLDTSLHMVSPAHPILADASLDRLFLGRDDRGGIFAADISNWSPDNVTEFPFNTFLDDTRQVHPAVADEAGFAELRVIMTQLSAREAELVATAKGMIGWHNSHQFCANCGTKTTWAMAGWQRDCPNCERHHFPRTDPVVIMLITHEDSVLVGRSPFWPEGMYSLLAGFVEPGETIEAAVRRETMEEAGVQVGAVSYLASQPWPFPASLMFGCAGEAVSTGITLDPDELEDAMWITRADMETVFAGQHPVMKPARKGAIAHFLLENWLAGTLG